MKKKEIQRKNYCGKLLSAFGNALRNLRKSRGLSQEKLSFLCELDRTYISGLERGKRNPSLKTLYIVAKNLDVSISDLLISIKTKEEFDGRDTKN